MATSAAHYVVACGGTGGHIFPGLATAQELRARGHAVTLWVAGREVEQHSLKGWDGGIVRVPSRGLTGRSPLAIGRTLGAWVSAIRRSKAELKGNRPDAVLAMGSYSSVGPVIAARLLKIPVVLHEANAIPGRAVSMLARFAVAVGTTFPGCGRWLAARKCVRTGLPLRRCMQREAGSSNGGRFTVLVMGGSQGAHRLNELAVEAFCSMWSRGERDVHVIHLTGRNDEEWVRGQYQQVGLSAEVYGFLGDMAEAYRRADVAVCRSGASSCMELCAMRIPAFLVPLPHAVKGHQKANAVAMAERDAALWAVQASLEPGDIESFVVGCRRSPERVTRMRAALADLAISDGAVRLSDLVESTAN